MNIDIHSKGSPHAQVWIIAEEPYEQDKEKRFIFSGSYGYIFDKMLRDAGIDEYHVIARRPVLGDRHQFKIIENDLNHYKPPIIICLEEAGKYLCPELRVKWIKSAKVNEEKSSAIEKYAGSLLCSDLLNYPHYIIPTFSPSTIARDWSSRDIVTSIDLGKAKSELDYYRRYGTLQPLLRRQLIYDFDGPAGFSKLKSILLNRFKNAKLLSNDIESIYPKKYANKPSIFYGKHPGYPVTIGLADAVDFGISFNLFRESPSETLELWRILDDLFQTVPQLGQNFYNFDSFYYEMLGFDFKINPIDTLIRHHILWPELPHKLQFQTRQYTREVYYKDEGHGWSAKDLDKLKRYNCLDACVTMEVYLAQEEEFKERPYLI